MAIETGAIFKKLYFDGTSSGDYGVYISGAGTFNAPKRDVEMVSIPGRNGTLALDKGRFENIEVTYHAGLYGVDEADFAEAVSDFRNFLCSRNGYVRLEDDYNPSEYRMAVYKSGLDVDANLLKAGEFDLIFDCKPQRWLKSGEEAVTVASGDTMDNPTLFESSPLLEVEGNGIISFNGYDIEIYADELGYTEIQPAFSFDIPLSKVLTSPLFNPADDINVGQIVVRWGIDAKDALTGGFYKEARTARDPARDTGDGTTVVETNFDGSAKRQARMATTFPAHLFSGASAGSMTDVAFARFDTNPPGSSGTYFSFSVTATITVTYTPSTQTLSVTVSGTTTLENYASFIADTSHCAGVYAYSTVNVLGHPTYIDCDLGEAYKYESGEYVSLNKHIDLGSDLPKLASGTNEITFDNTITELKIHPRWWKI